MDYLTPEDNYLVVLPNGMAITFKDIEGCHAYINRYYEEKIKLNGIENIYANYDMYEEKSREDIARVIGAEEGEAKIYELESVIEQIRKSSVFVDESDDIINKLMSNKCKIDISDYGIDSALLNSEQVIY